MVTKCRFHLQVLSALALLMKALTSQLAQTTLYIFLYMPEKTGDHFIQQRRFCNQCRRKLERLWDGKRITEYTLDNWGLGIN